MNRQTSFRILFLLLLIFIHCTSGWTQVAVERSKDKVVIAGVSYYLHPVRKGETIYSIARTYDITTSDLARENPSVTEGLKEGQSLRIPARLVSTTSMPEVSQVKQKPKDDSRFLYHKLQPGETIYFLSKKYSVSENEIVQSNPDIDINKLPLGYEIAIPRKSFMDQKQNFTVQETRPYYHKVVKGETLYSIARRYRIPLRELRRENRDIRFPQVGDSLRIPGKVTAIEKPVEAIVSDSVPETPGDEVIYLERPSEYTPVSNLSGSLNVAVLLPFYLNENTRRNEIDSSRIIKGKRVYSEISMHGDWIYPGSLGFIEMYEGILLAADTLRSLGMNINLHVFDIRADTIEITRLIRSGRLDRMDLIIGPVYSTNLLKVANYAGQLGIPVVSPVQLYTNSVLANNPSLFLASSSLAVAQDRIAGKAAEYFDHNIVFIHSDTSVTNPDVSGFRNKILAGLRSRMPVEEISFREMIFYSRSAFGADSVNRLSHTLTENRGNVVIIASEDAPVMIETVQDIHNLSKKFDIKVIGYPEMRQLVNIDPKFLFELGLMIYSPYWIDYSSPDVKQFCSDFLSKFHTQPSEISYAWEGYDIAYYFLSGLAIHGKEFVLHPEIHNPDLLYTGFDFKRRTIYEGFENQKLFLIRYTNNYELELVKDPGGYTLK
jgi:LysM repeat protein